MPAGDPVFDAAYEAFGALIDGEILAQLLEEEIYESLLNGVTGATREEALSIAREQAGTLVADIINTTREGIAEIIAQGMEEQIGVDAIARNLRDQIGLTPQRLASVNNYRKELEKQGLPQAEIDQLVEKFTKAQIKDRAEVIATTELRNAMEKGEFMVMKDRGARYKAAITVGDSDVSDTCQRNEAQGPIPIDDNFDSGHSTAPFHVKCRCRTTYITSDEQLERAGKRAAERAERTAEAKKTSDEESE